MLGGDIGADPRVAGQRPDRRIVDDRSAPLTFHLPQFVLHAAPYTTQIDSNHPVPIFASAVGGRGDVGHDAGVVECGVYTAELGNGALHHRFHLRVVTYVTAY